MKKKFALNAAILLFAAPIFAVSGTTDWLMPDAGPPAFSSQQRPEIDSSRLPGRRPTMLGMFLGGVAGNLAGAIGLGALGLPFDSSHESLIPLGTVVGAPVGSVFGSALGVCLAGNTRYWRGNFGSALLGGVMGLFSACLVSVLLPGTFQDLGVVYFSLLPPLGAAAFFNATLDRRFARSQGALFNFSRGDFAMGVPDFQVGPLFVPGIDAIPRFQFKVKVLSVEL